MESLSNIPPWIIVCCTQLHKFHGSDVFYNGAKNGFILKETNQVIPLETPFCDQNSMVEQLREFAAISHQRLDLLKPFAGGSFQWAHHLYRWHMVIPPASGGAPLFTLRVHKLGENVPDLAFAFSGNDHAKLHRLMEEKANMLICGETGSGKTTLLVQLMQQYCAQERVIILEDACEVPLISSLWIKLLTREANPIGLGHIGYKELVEESLRLRPDRVVCGEIRTGDAVRFFEVLHTGTKGCLSTFHGRTPAMTRTRLEMLLKEKSLEQLLQNNPLWGVFMERGDPPFIREIQII